MYTQINLNRLDLVSLRLYVAVIDGGSLTAGAERLGISLAAASKRIAELEAHLGTPLLHRSRRGITTTAAGDTLRRHAIALVADLTRLAVAMDDCGRGVHSHLRIRANTSAFGGFLADILSEYSTIHPTVKLDLEDAQSDDALRAVTEGSAELAVIGANTPCDGLETVPCHCDELVLIVPTRHPLASLSSAPFLRSLDYDFVTLPDSIPITRRIAAEAESAGRLLNVRIQVRNFDSVCLMVASGLGIAIVPLSLALRHVRSLELRIVRLEGIQTGRRLSVAMRRREALSAAARDFVALAERRMAQAPGHALRHRA